MSLKNEIFEGITAYKALTPTAEDKYKGEMYKIAKRENDDYEERKQKREEEIAKGKPTPDVPQQIQQNVPTMSRSDTIGPGPSTVGSTVGNQFSQLRRGGRVRRYADGGFASGLAAGVKSTLQSPRAININQWRRPPRARDAGIPGSDDAARDAADRYGSVEAEPTVATGPPQSLFVPTNGSADGGTGNSGGVGGNGVGDSGATGGVGGNAGVSGEGADSGTGGVYRRGGRVRRGRAIRTNYRAGGAVTPHDDDDEPDEMSTKEPVYRPGEDDPPEVQRRYEPTPEERSQRERRDWTDTDTSDDGGTYQGEGRYKWRPNYQKGGQVEKDPWRTEMTEELYPGAGQGEGDDERVPPPPGFKGGTMWEEETYEDQPGRPTNLPEQPRRVRRAKAFDDGGVASAFRGGRPAYNPDEDPNVQERNRADAIIREIISAQVGEPNAANDPSLELRERGEADRAKYRALIPQPPQHDDPSAQINARGTVDREAARSKSGDVPPYEGVPTVQAPSPSAPRAPAEPDPNRVGPTPAAATRAELEAKYRSVIPEPPEPEEGDPSEEINQQGEQTRTERRQDDSGLTVDNAPDPYREPQTEAEKEDPANYRRPYKPNIGSPQAMPSPPPADYPATAPGELTKPQSSAGAWVDRNLPHVIPGSRKSTGDEAAADRRWQESINQRRFDLRTNPLEKITPEERERRRVELAKLDAEEAAGSPSERLRARRRAIETGTPVSAFLDNEPKPIGPIEAAVDDTTQAVRTGMQGALPIAGKPPPGQPAAPANPAAPAQPAQPATPAPAGPRPAGAGDPSVYGPVIQRPAHDPDYTGMNDEKANLRPLHTGRQGNYGPYWEPTGAKPSGSPPIQPPPAAATTGATTGATTTGATTGTNTPGGHPNAATPPPGAADANRPSTAEKPETRTAAYDPTTDRADPSTGRTMPRQLDAQGRAIATGPPTQMAQGDGGPPGSPATGQITRTSSTQTYGDSGPGSLSSATGYSNQDIAQTLHGATSLVRPGVNGGPPPIGHLAASPPALNAYVQHHNQNGRFTPGEAILVGMVSDYKMLLKQGRITQANQMAYGLLQAANIEAASHGMVARDKLAAGDTRGAAQSMVNGLNYIADGVSQRLSADGHYMESYDPRTGAVTARTPLDGQTILAGIMGLADGTLFWKTLQASAQMLQKPDRGAEGRQLSNELRRRQIALADKRLAMPSGGGRRGGPTTSGGMSQVQRELARIRGEPVAPPQQSSAPPVDNDGYPTDLAVINAPVVDYQEDGDTGNG